jgi:hypothetical protein
MSKGLRNAAILRHLFTSWMEACFSETDAGFNEIVDTSTAQTSLSHCHSHTIMVENAVLTNVVVAIAQGCDLYTGTRQKLSPMQEISQSSI